MNPRFSKRGSPVRRNAEQPTVTLVRVRRVPEEELHAKDEESQLPFWSIADSIVFAATIVISTASRFWHLGRPAETVYDETRVLRQAHAFLNGWPPPYSTHPPAAKLLVALSVYLFGNSPWGWRAGNALIGAALAPVTYLLARRLFASRSAASIAAGLVLCEGFYLVASRLAMINIVYITASAAAYLMLWRFVQERQSRRRRFHLVTIGVMLGLFVAAKAAISEVGVVLILSVVAITVVAEETQNTPAQPSYRTLVKVIGTCGLVTAILLIVYLACFLPYFQTVWSSVGDLIAYHRRALHRNLTFPQVFENSSPVWSWPLLLAPYAYWKRDMLNGMVRVIWCGGNPLLWWGIPAAVLIACVRAYSRRSLPWLFLAAGYVAYLAMWIPIRRYLFIYSYLPALYLGLLALAGSLAECWTGRARVWEQAALLAPVLACVVYSLRTVTGALSSGGMLIVYMFLTLRDSSSGGKFVFIAFSSVAVCLAIYFFPIWTGVAISKEGYMARMWFRGPGLVNWLRES